MSRLNDLLGAGPEMIEMLKLWENPMLSQADQLEAAKGRIDQLEQMLERASVGHKRYETARRMNPRQWADAWKLNTTTGKHFDEIIDDMRPFMVPD